jgi:RNA polymerase sigma-70 factor (ECF subfamily)
LYQASCPRLVSSLTAVVGARDLAEELAAEAFARAYARWSTVAAMASRDGWVYRVAVNLATSRWRRLGHERRWVERQGNAASVHGGADGGADPDVDPRLWAALRRLGPRARTAVALRYVADPTQPQIAEIMGVSVGTVASTLHTARRALATALAPTEEVTDRA